MIAQLLLKGEEVVIKKNLIVIVVMVVGSYMLLEGVICVCVWCVVNDSTVSELVK